MKNVVFDTVVPENVRVNIAPCVDIISNIVNYIQSKIYSKNGSEYIQVVSKTVTSVGVNPCNKKKI